MPSRVRVLLAIFGGVLLLQGISKAVTHYYSQWNPFRLGMQPIDADWILAAVAILLGFCMLAIAYGYSAREIVMISGAIVMILIGGWKLLAELGMPKLVTLASAGDVFLCITVMTGAVVIYVLGEKAGANEPQRNT